MFPHSNLAGCLGTLGAMRGAVVQESPGRTPNVWTVSIDGPSSGIRKLGLVIFNKILNDQKKLLKSNPVPGFRVGTMPPYLMPRIKAAALREIVRETCVAALEENNKIPASSQEYDDLEVSYPDHPLDCDVPAFLKASGWKPGDDFSFVARNVRSLSSGNSEGIFADGLNEDLRRRVAS